jgi:hypothetical protein
MSYLASVVDRNRGAALLPPYCVVAESDGCMVGSNCLDERFAIAGLGPPEHAELRRWPEMDGSGPCQGSGAQLSWSPAAPIGVS